MNHRTEILPGVYLTAVQSDKFKTGCFSLNLLRPMKKEEAAANALSPSVLLRGSVVVEHGKSLGEVTEVVADGITYQGCTSGNGKFIPGKPYGLGYDLLKR